MLFIWKYKWLRAEILYVQPSLRNVPGDQIAAISVEKWQRYRCPTWRSSDCTHSYGTDSWEVRFSLTYACKQGWKYSSRFSWNWGISNRRSLFWLSNSSWADSKARLAWVCLTMFWPVLGALTTLSCLAMALWHSLQIPNALLYTYTVFQNDLQNVLETYLIANSLFLSADATLLNSGPSFLHGSATVRLK